MQLWNEFFACFHVISNFLGKFFYSGRNVLAELTPTLDPPLIMEYFGVEVKEIE